MPIQQVNVQQLQWHAHTPVCYGERCDASGFSTPELDFMIEPQSSIQRWYAQDRQGHGPVNQSNLRYCRCPTIQNCARNYPIINRTEHSPIRQSIPDHSNFDDVSCLGTLCVVFWTHRCSRAAGDVHRREHGTRLLR